MVYASLGLCDVVFLDTYRMRKPATVRFVIRFLTHRNRVHRDSTRVLRFFDPAAAAMSAERRKTQTQPWKPRPG